MYIKINQFLNITLAKHFSKTWILNKASLEYATYDSVSSFVKVSAFFEYSNCLLWYSFVV